MSRAPSAVGQVLHGVTTVMSARLHPGEKRPARADQRTHLGTLIDCLARKSAVLVVAVSPALRGPAPGCSAGAPTPRPSPHLWRLARRSGAILRSTAGRLAQMRGLARRLVMRLPVFSIFAPPPSQAHIAYDRLVGVDVDHFDDLLPAASELRESLKLHRER